jgi:hypothetical protein
MAANVSIVNVEVMCESFHTPEGFSNIARRLHVSPNTLRRVWVEAFGADQVLSRTRENWAESGRSNGAKLKGKTKSMTYTSAICSECGEDFPLSVMAKAKTCKFVCDKCENSRVDHTCSYCGVGCIGAKGLATHYRHMKDDPAHVDAGVISKEDLERFTLKNGKVVIGWAMIGLEKGAGTIKKEAKRHGLKTYGRYIMQGQCITSVAHALGCQVGDFIHEWVVPGFNGKYRFDGYLKTHDLVVEFHGYQHWTYPNVYMKSEDQFMLTLARDKEKMVLVRTLGLKLFLVRQDEPFTEVPYIRSRLVSEGVLHG